MSRQTIFVTGAASGIGKATALAFHQRGRFVGATDVDEAGLKS
ncbi:MAG: NAD(P)-dependent dehydrogenase (short-subunit alcohol dehydrogenase family) [Candidatus Azotimanducaceae bacterium]|jgi:NAD(P)-dependent dehydrogenase (short-subunit alcohol dehydrogenase family)